MSWTAIVVLAVGAYIFKALGLLGLGRRGLDPRVQPFVALLPAALFAALVTIQTFDGGRRIELGARLVGVAVAGVAAWRRAPFVVVVVLAMAVTALVRL